MNNQTHILPLKPNPAKTKQLKSRYQALFRQLEPGTILQEKHLAPLRETMQEVIEADKEWASLLKNSEWDHHYLHLTHQDMELLNLPWRLIEEFS